MPKFTRWFSIEDDGQPARPGWYDQRYHWEGEDTPEESLSTGYWDGKRWLWDESGNPISFGNWNTKGEYWRGLAEDPNAAPSAAAVQLDAQDTQK